MAMRSRDDTGSKGGGSAGPGNASAAGSDGLVIIYNVIANRSVPIVFILVSSLIIANISCDQVGSANGEFLRTPVQFPHLSLSLPQLSSLMNSESLDALE